jgi:ABC-type glycerol-3-phosphate transport system substrate-binding protein
MFQKRSLSFLVASLGIAAGLAIVASPNYAAAGDAVDCGSVKTAAVKATCTAHKGDKKAIQDAMKKAVGDYKKANPAEKIDCKSCHNEDGSAKANAATDFDAKLAKFYK